MKIMKYLLLISLLTLAFTASAFANNENDTHRADEWFMKDRLKSPAPKSNKSLEDYVKEGQERLKNKERYGEIVYDKSKFPRYVMLFRDDSFIYWLDTEALRWREMPYSAFEDMVDCWVKMEDISEDKEYTYPEKYYMEHLYLRPKKQQIMFLSELEVTGKPDNNIKERRYKPEFWEELVPGSVEQEIYKGTLAVLKVLEKKGVVRESEKKEKYNFFEDTLGIAGIF